MQQFYGNMGQRWNSNCCLLLFLFTTLTISIISVASDSPPSPTPGRGCTWTSCGLGTCRDSNDTAGFECDCYPGWLKFFDSSACIIPNCTIDWTCGGKAPGPPPPPPPPPPPFSLFPPIDLSCFLVFCGDGHCVPNGTDHICECNSGSENLLGSYSLPCMKKCSLGLDCHGVTLGRPTVTTPPPPPASSSAPPSIGRLVAEPPNCSRNVKVFSMVLLVTIAMVWI